MSFMKQQNINHVDMTIYNINKQTKSSNNKKRYRN